MQKLKLVQAFKVKTIHIAGDTDLHSKNKQAKCLWSKSTPSTTTTEWMVRKTYDYTVMELLKRHQEHLCPRYGEEFFNVYKHR